jgi:hypothetical protein
LKFGKFFAFTLAASKRIAQQNLFHSAPSLASCHSFCFADFFHLFIGHRKIEGILYPQKAKERHKKLRFTFDMIVCRRARLWKSEICVQFNGDVIGERGGERYIMIIAIMLSNYKFLALSSPCAISTLMADGDKLSFLFRKSLHAASSSCLFFYSGEFWVCFRCSGAFLSTFVNEILISMA